MPVEHMRQVPAPWARANRATAAALLLAETKTLRALRAAIKRAIEHAVASVALATPGRGRSHVIHVLRDAARAMTTEIGTALLVARKDARAASNARLAVSLTLAERQIRALGYDVALEAPEESDGDEDAAHADAAARSYAAAWTASSLRIVAKWTDAGEEQSIARLLAKTEEQFDYRTRRIATTETAQAFNDEADEGIGYIAQQHEGEPWVAGFVKRWDAILDRLTCRVCAEHDGELALPGMSWDGDDEPGFVHTCCRCMSTTIFIAARVPGADEGGEYEADDEGDDEEAA